MKHNQEHHLQLVVPRLLVPGVLYMMHDRHGHLGVDKTHDLIRHRYFWPNSYRDTHAYINKCFVCAQRKLKALRVPIQSMPVPNAPFMTVAMDLQGPFPETENGDHYILSLVCLFSGWPEAFPIANKNADTIARALMTEFIPRHSCPECLISDQGSEFCNEVISILSRKMGIVRIRTSPYRPQANGKCERLHRVLNDIIAKRMAENQLDWPHHIPAALHAIRTSVHTSSKHPPFFLVHGRDPKLSIDTLLQSKFKYVGEDYVPVMIERLHRAFVEVKANMRESQKRNQDNQGAIPRYRNSKLAIRFSMLNWALSWVWAANLQTIGYLTSRSLSRSPQWIMLSNIFPQTQSNWSTQLTCNGSLVTWNGTKNSLPQLKL